MRPHEEMPVMKPGTRDDETVFTHPAFGQISASRVSGGSTLYGSDFEHQHYMTISIRASELHRSLNRDWHFARDELISVALSEAQWARFVSTPNSGGGTPCTLEHVAGERRPFIPRRQQADVFKAEAREAVREAVEELDKSIAEMEGTLGSSLSKTKRDALLAGLRNARAKMAARVPWINQQLAEHMETTIEYAKIEVEAYVEQTIRRAGAEALANGGPLLLGRGDEVSE